MAERSRRREEAEDFTEMRGLVFRLLTSAATLSFALEKQPHLDTAPGPRLYPKDQPQRARMPKGSGMIPTRTPARSRCGWCSAAVRFPALFGGPTETEDLIGLGRDGTLSTVQAEVNNNSPLEV